MLSGNLLIVFSSSSMFFFCESDACKLFKSINSFYRIIQLPFIIFPFIDSCICFHIFGGVRLDS